MFYIALLSLVPWLTPLVAGHSCLWSEAMWGFNVTAKTFPYDNRPVVPLMDMTFDEWWLHNHQDYPPPENTFLELPAGGTLHSQVSCDKGATSFFASSPGGDIQSGNNPCPGSPTNAFHANSIEDTRGCGIGIAYKTDVNDLKPEDFTIITTNRTCVWYRFTDFQIPADLPACPDGGCICSFNWIHAPDSGSAQMFFNAYRCKVTNANSNKQLATPRLARRCGLSPDNKDVTPAPWNCTYGAKQAIYWLQKEGNTFFEGDHDPPYYNAFYGYPDGAQNDVFQDSQIPVFNDRGEQTGFTTLGGSTATTANIVTPTISSGWPTTAPGQPTDSSSSGSGSSGSGSSGSGSSGSGSSGSGDSGSSDPAPTSSSTQAAVNTNVVENPQPASPTPNASSSASTSSASTPSTATKCRKRNAANKAKRAKKRAFRAHEKMSKRHDGLF